MAKRKSSVALKKELECVIFRAFLESRSDLKGKGWDVGDDPPDFVLQEEPTGIELGQWLHEDQTQRSQELDRFKREIQEAAASRGLQAFLRSFSGAATPRYNVMLDVREIPAGRDKPVVISKVLEFLSERTREPILGEDGLVIRDSDLPDDLKKVFHNIWISISRRTVSLGIEVSRGGAFVSKTALSALKILLSEKVEYPRYQNLKSEKRLSELWLVIYYDYATCANTPYWGIAIEASDKTDEEEIVQQARAHLRGIGHGPFDRVYLFFKHKGLTFDLFP